MVSSNNKPIFFIDLSGQNSIPVPSLSSSSTSSSSSPSVVTSECCTEVERVDTMDSDSNPWIDDASASDHQDAVTNSNIDREVKNQVVDSCSDATASDPRSCSKSQHPVRDTATKMIDAQ